MPPQEFVVLNNTNSLFVVLLGPFLLQEWPTKKILVLVLISFLGILLVVNPGLLGLGVLKTVEQDVSFYGYMCALASGLGSAGVTLFLKAFGKFPSESLFFKNNFLT